MRRTRSIGGPDRAHWKDGLDVVTWLRRPANKFIPFKRTTFLAYPAKTSDAQTKFQKTQTCSNLLSKFLHLDENSRQNDAAVDQ